MCLLVVALPACPRADDTAEPRIVVGVGSTTEQRALAALTVQVLREADMAPEVRPGLGGTVGLRREAIGGNIDVFWDYTGAAWALGMGQQAPPADAEESFRRVSRADEENGLTWLGPSAANATLGLFVRRTELPPEDQPRGLAWLAGVLSAGDEHLCADQEFITRSGGLEALASAYAIDLERLTDASIPAAEAAAITGVASRRCFAALATATSGEAVNAGLVQVTDDLAVFPAFSVAPVVRTERLEAVPRLAEAVERITAVLDTPALAALNARIENGRDPADVAEDFLAESVPGS
jgi:osmoprotectant transport system substrate-binding protein